MLIIMSTIVTWYTYFYVRVTIKLLPLAQLVPLGRGDAELDLKESRKLMLYDMWLYVYNIAWYVTNTIVWCV